MPNRTPTDRQPDPPGPDAATAVFCSATQDQRGTRWWCVKYAHGENEAHDWTNRRLEELKREKRVAALADAGADAGPPTEQELAAAQERLAEAMAVEPEPEPLMGPTDQDGAPLASVAAENAYQQATEAETEAIPIPLGDIQVRQHPPAPYRATYPDGPPPRRVGQGGRTLGAAMASVVLPESLEPDAAAFARNHDAAMACARLIGDIGSAIALRHLPDPALWRQLVVEASAVQNGTEGGSV